MKITVFGLGAIGSNLIIQLMKQYPDFEFVGVDYDKIEERNIKTQAYFLEQVGMPKAHAIPIIASRFIRKPKYTPLNKKIIEILKIEDDKDHLYLDCFDNASSRKLISSGKYSNVLHIGFSPHYTSEIIWDERYDVPNDVDPSRNDICEMQEAVAFIHFIVNFASLVLSNYLISGKKDNYIITNKASIKSI